MFNYQQNACDDVGFMCEEMNCMNQIQSVKSATYVSHRPSMQHHMVWLVSLSTQTLWTSMMVSCQTSTKRILTLGTCPPLVWREAASTASMGTCSHHIQLQKVTSDLNGVLDSNKGRDSLLPVYTTTAALWLQSSLKVGFDSCYMHFEYTHKDKERILRIYIYIL